MRVLFLILALGTTCLYAAAPVFQTPIPVEVGSNVAQTDSGTGDFNLDRIPDFVITRNPAGAASPFVETFIANGDGTFTKSPATNVASFQSTRLIGDVNGDEIPDLVSIAGDRFVIYHGAVNGTFSLQSSYFLSAVEGVATGDVDHDGDADLVAVKENQIHTFRGTAVPVVTSGVIGPIVGALFMLDVNGDDSDDLFYSGPNDVYLHLATGTGGFGSAIYIGPSNGAYAVEDIDHDEFDDVVTAHGIAWGNGDGTFSEMAGGPFGGFEPTAILTDDFNGDDLDDIAVAHTRHISIHINLGSRTLGPPTTYVTPTGTPHLGDFDDDDVLDILKTPIGVNQRFPFGFIVRGNADGTFAAPRAFEMPDANRGLALTLAAADTTGDGIEDAIAISENFIAVLPGTGTALGTPVLTPVLAQSDTLPIVGDVTNDGKADVLTHRSSSYQVWISNGDGTFTAQVQEFGGIAGTPFLDDFTGDGHVDFAVAGASIEVYPGDGAGHFGAAIVKKQELRHGVLSADVNHDGHPDFYGIPNEPVLEQGVLLLNNGDGTFRVAGTFDNLWVNSFVDMNGDGTLDMVIDDYPRTAIRPGNGDGTFAPATSVYGDISHLRGDFNGDGAMDWVGQDGDSVLLGGAGGFSSRMPLYDMPGSNVTFAAMDVDGNGSDDVLTFGWGFLDVMPTMTTASQNLPIAITLNATATSVSATVTPSAGFPALGSVRIAVDGVIVALVDAGQTVPLNLTPGTYSISASFLGDSIYGTATAFATITATLPAGTPTTVTATATSSSNIAVSWLPMANVTSYQLYRDGVLIATTASTSMNDGGRAPNTTHRYRVVANGLTSNTDIATTIAFTDATIVAGATIVKLAHFEELRTAVNAVRANASLAPFAFTNPPALLGLVRTSHISELRTALTEARNAIGLTTTFSDTGSVIRAVHVNELRALIR